MSAMALNIKDLVPHSGRMLLLDKVTAVAASFIRCQSKVRTDNLFYDEVLAGVPGWIGLELMAQTASAWGGYTNLKKKKPPSVGFLLGVRRYILEEGLNKDERNKGIAYRYPAAAFFPLGTVLEMEAKMVLIDKRLSAFECSISCEGEVVARAQLNAFTPTVKQLRTGIFN